MRLLFILLSLLSLSTLSAQEYFQQEVDYVIDVTLHDADHRLKAKIEMVYTNHSPDELTEIYMHLWPNAYNSKHTALGEQLEALGDGSLQFSKLEERGAISGIAFKIDGEAVSYTDHEGHSDVVRLALNNPIPAGASVSIETPFEVKIPVGRFSRLGHIGDSYQITQWYPKPAVYDQDGWHPMPYLTQGEFYSEFGSFDVHITLPQNYVVAATGELQTETERDFLMAKAAEASEITLKDITDEFPKSSTEMKTLHYTQDQVHDFAWFADKRFYVMHERFALDSGKEIDGWAFFTDNYSYTWAKSMEYIVEGTRHYSRHVGDYPYSAVSIVDGTLSAGGGMEYPMVTVINGTANPLELERVVVHEIGHNWFYGILGSNERDHAWMDEGVNSYYEQSYFDAKYGEKNTASTLAILGQASSRMGEAAVRLSTCSHMDQALSTPSGEFSNVNYGTMVYMKGAMVMDQLEMALGTEVYEQAMHDYYQDWAFKHPGPADMRASLERSCGQDLGWLFDDLIATRTKVDHRVGHFDMEDNTLTVKSRTSYKGPIAVGFYKDSLLVETLLGQGKEIKLKPSQDFDRAVIDPQYKSMQMLRRNDTYMKGNVLPRWRMPQFKLGTSAGLSDRPTLYYLPVAAWNEQDRWLFGLYLSNVEGIFKNTEYSLLPLYSISADDWAGMGSIRQTFWLGEQSHSRIDLELKARRFSAFNIGDIQQSYNAQAPALRFIHQRPGLKSARHEIAYEGYRIETEPNDIVSPSFVRKDFYHSLVYGYDKDMGLSNLTAQFMYEHHETFDKVTLELGYERDYNESGKALRARIYGGLMEIGDELIPLGARLSLNGQSGRGYADGTTDDYRGELLLMGRNSFDTYFSRQTARNRGGFIQPTGRGYSNQAVLAANVEVDLPVKLPISLFANMGTAFNRGLDENLLYEIGGRFTVLKDILDVSFPIVFSEDIRTTLDLNDVKYARTIRIQLRLEELGLRKFLNKQIF